jgi:hypothetical protein
MQKYTHVEDYIEIIGGWRDPLTGKTLPGHNTLWFSFTPIISLARYDVSVLDHMCENAIANKPLTTRQGDLAVKIILKYSRQLAQKGIDVSPVENPQWRNKLRVMDYSKKLYIQDDKIMLEFPFSTELIDGLREFRKDSQGKGEWNKDKRRWEYALTEYNLVYLKTWAETNQFNVDEEAIRYNNIIEDVERATFAIELDFVDEQLAVKNASPALIEYIETQCGGFAYENLGRLIDMSSVLGYTVNADIAAAWENNHGTVLNILTMLRELKVDLTKTDSQEILSSVVKYAELTNRYPLVIFEPDLSGKLLTQLYNCVAPEQVFVPSRRNGIIDIPEDVKYIHTTVPLKNKKIPLLISTAGMMFGGDKSLMTQNAEKAIYFATEVYTHKKEHKVPEFESQSNNP